LTVSVLTAAQLLARPCCVARACRLNGAPGFRRAAPLLPSRASRLCELPRPSRALVCSSLPTPEFSLDSSLQHRGAVRSSTRRLNALTCLSFPLGVAPNRSHTSHSSMFPVASKLPCWQAAATTPSPRLTQDTRVRTPFLSRTSKCSCAALLRRLKPTPVLYLPALWYQPAPSHRTSLFSLGHSADGSAVGCDRRSVAQE
jgi:hypothetical protein